MSEALKIKPVELDYQLVEVFGGLAVYVLKNQQIFFQLLDRDDFIDVAEGDLLELKYPKVVMSYGASIYGCITGVLLLNGQHYFFHTEGGYVNETIALVLNNKETVGIVGGNRTAFIKEELDASRLKFIDSDEHDKPYLSSDSSFQVIYIPDKHDLLPKGIYYFYG